MIFELPHGQNIEIKTLVLDLNGTLTVHGKVPEGVYEQIDQLRYKEEAILKLEPQTCASIGNARIDIGTFKHARVSILTLQSEGIHAETIQYADIIVPSIQDALSLFIDKKAFEATMRK